MPLLGLEDIEWNKLSHAYGSANNIPDLLQAVDGAKSQQEFENVLSDLWNYIYHQGTLYQATSYTLKFTIQILRNTDVLERKVLLLMCIGETLRTRDSASISDMRETLATYDSVVDELDYFLGCLCEDVLELQFASLFILSFLSEEAEKVMPALLDCFHSANDGQLKAGIVWVYSQFLKKRFLKSRQLDLNQLVDWIENDTDSYWIRLAAAYGYLSIPSPLRASPMAIQLVAQSLILEDRKHQQHTNRNISYLCSELLPFPDLALIWSRSEVWIEVLKVLNPSPTQAHLLGREIMNSAFPRSSHSSWDKPNDWTNQDRIGFRDVLIFIQYKPRFQKYISPLVGHGLNDAQRRALQTVVNCEPFWEIPTNLFSFFYGLPDDREDLRKLAEGK